MLKLTTNDGEFIIGMHPTLEQVGRYYAGMAKRGIPIEDIKFQVSVIQPESIEKILARLVPDALRMNIEGAGMSAVNRIAHR